jgi:hypothetical protein
VVTPATAPEVIGPVVSERPPWGAPGAGPSENAYVVEEFLLDGIATAYRLARPGPIPMDGRWEVTEVGDAPFTTRILVIRPTEAVRFNGTVLLNWQNVSAGVEASAPSGGEIYAGYAWVGVSAQEVGLYGLPAGMNLRWSHRQAQPLVEYDPARYGRLHHPGDQGSYDIFAAAAMAVGPQRDRTVDPLGGLDVRRVVALGASQSAMRLATYLNALHQRRPIIDGFVLALWEGRAPRPEEGPIAYGIRTAIRDDLDQPVMVVNSEFETLAVHQAEVADSRMVRIWEVAGTPHAVARMAEPQEPAAWGRNPLSIQPVFEAAVRMMHRWTAGEGPAPRQPRIEVEDRMPPRIRRDQYGNAIGGIRLPDLAVPTAEYRGMAFGTGLPPLFGASRPLDQQALRELYPTRAVYRARWFEAVDALVATGALRPEDAPALRERAEQAMVAID